MTAYILRGVDDPALARRAMQAAAEAVLTVPHPEEPEDPFVSFVSGVEEVDGSLMFWFDDADVEAYDGVAEDLHSAIVRAVAEAGVVDGRVERYDREAPPRRPRTAAPKKRQASASVPEGFPLPEGAEWMKAMSYRTVMEPGEVVAFYEDRLGARLVDQRTWTKHRPRAVSVFVTDILEFPYRGQPGYVAVMAVEVRPLPAAPDQEADEPITGCHFHITLDDPEVLAKLPPDGSSF